MKTDWNTFQLEIIKYGLLAAVLAEVISLPLTGWSPRFLYGLALGTAVAVMNFRIQAFFCRSILRRGSGMLAAVGFPIRMFIYAAAFLVCLRTGGECALGAACGFVTIPCGMFYQVVFARRRTVHGGGEGMQ